MKIKFEFYTRWDGIKQYGFVKEYFDYARGIFYGFVWGHRGVGISFW